MKKQNLVVTKFVLQISPGTRKSIRPFRNDLFIRNDNIFNDNYNRFEKIINRLKNEERKFNEANFS